MGCLDELKKKKKKKKKTYCFILQFSLSSNGRRLYSLTCCFFLLQNFAANLALNIGEIPSPHDPRKESNQIKHRIDEIRETRAIRFIFALASF